MSKTELFVKSAFLIFLGWLTFFIITRDGFTFLHNIDLIFHEAGHVFLTPFGQTAHFFGGTVGQLAIPIVLAVYFLVHRDYYASAVMSWWFGENLIDISIYVSDARALALPLLGGEHDWNYILAKYGILHHDIFIGKILFWAGQMTMILAILCGLYATNNIREK